MIYIVNMDISSYYAYIVLTNFIIKCISKVLIFAEHKNPRISSIKIRRFIDVSVSFRSRGRWVPRPPSSPWTSAATR